MTYQAEVLADTPLGFWLLDETSGTAATDASGNAQHGTYNGSPALATATMGNLTTPVFDGIDDWVALPAIPVVGAPFTLECVARCDVVVSQAEVFAETYAGGQDGIIAAIGLNVANAAAPSEITGGTFVGGTGSAPPNWVWHTVNGGTWTVGDVHHLAYTHDLTTASFYVDGALMGTMTFDPTVPNNGWRIGSIYTGGGAFKGAIGAAALYGTCLDLTRITAHYDALYAVDPPPAQTLMVGAGAVSAVALGSDLADAVYLGADLVWQPDE